MQPQQQQQQGEFTVRLNCGLSMPIIGLGTSSLDGPQAYDAIRCAVRAGYRFFDSAALYQNETLLGRALADAIRAGEVSRSELFICTKVWCTAHKRASVLAACRRSLARLQLQYVDLYLIHWPIAYEEPEELNESNTAADASWVTPRDPNTKRPLYSQTHYTETWLGMEDCHQLGLAKAIGLSNFNHLQCDQILAMCRVRPQVNQVECHAYLSQAKLAEYSRQKDILLNAYCPLGAPGADWTLPGAEAPPPRVIDDPLVRELANRHNKTPAQILLRYLIQRGIAPIPKSITLQRVEENIRVFDFQLDDLEMEQMLGLNKNLRYCTNTAGEQLDDHPLYPFHEDY